MIPIINCNRMEGIAGGTLEKRLLRFHEGEMEMSHEEDLQK